MPKSPDLIKAMDDAIRGDLQSFSDSFFWLALMSSLIVVIGVAFEGPELLHELWPKMFPVFAKRWVKKIGFIGWLLVVLGVGGEVIFGLLEYKAQGLLQTFNDILLTDAQRQSSDANERASMNEKEAAQLRKDAEDEALERVTLESEFVKEEPRITLLEWHKSQIAKRLLPLAGQKFLVGNCFRIDDTEAIRAASSLMGTLEHEAKWINAWGPSMGGGENCSGSGMFVSVPPNATEATRNNAKVLFSLLQNILKTGVFLDDTGPWKLYELPFVKGRLDQETILIIVFEHPYPLSPPHISNDAK
jgi:hypothetical protein